MQELSKGEQSSKDQLAASHKKHEYLVDQINKLTADSRSLEADIAASKDETQQARRTIEVIHAFWMKSSV